MNKEKRYQILTRLRDENPTPTTELVHGSTFELLVAVMLSAQATDVSVNKATTRLYKKTKTPEKENNLGEGGVEKYKRGKGDYKRKGGKVSKNS